MLNLLLTASINMADYQYMSQSLLRVETSGCRWMIVNKLLLCIDPNRIDLSVTLAAVAVSDVWNVKTQPGTA